MNASQTADMKSPLKLLKISFSIQNGNIKKSRSAIIEASNKDEVRGRNTLGLEPLPIIITKSKEPSWEKCSIEKYIKLLCEN